MTDITRRSFIQKFSTAAVAAGAFNILPSRADETVPGGNDTLDFALTTNAGPASEPPEGYQRIVRSRAEASA